MAVDIEVVCKKIARGGKSLSAGGYRTGFRLAAG